MRHCETRARCNNSFDARATGEKQRATIKTRRSATTHRRCCMEFCFMIRATKESSLSAGAMSASSSIGVSPSASASSAMIIARRDAIDSSSHLLALNVSRRTCASHQFEKHRNWDAMMHQSDNRVFVRFANPPESFIFRCNLAENCENPENNAGVTHMVRGTLETMSLMMAGSLARCSRFDNMRAWCWCLEDTRVQSEVRQKVAAEISANMNIRGVLGGRAFFFLM